MHGYMEYIECIYEWKDEWIYEWMGGWDAWTHWMDELMDGYIER